jgi:hypothetical protein
MVVKIYTRRSRKQLIRFGDPLLEKPHRAKQIIKNTIYGASKSRPSSITSQDE